jgi:hypothetical protein
MFSNRFFIKLFFKIKVTPQVLKLPDLGPHKPA